MAAFVGTEGGRELRGEHLRVQRAGSGAIVALAGGHVGAAARKFGGDRGGRARDQVDGLGRVCRARRGFSRGQGGNEVVDFTGNPRLGSRRAGNVVGDVMGGNLEG